MIIKRSIITVTEQDYRLSITARPITDPITRQTSRQALHAFNCTLTVAQHNKALMHHFGVGRTRLFLVPASCFLKLIVLWELAKKGVAH